MLRSRLLYISTLVSFFLIPLFSLPFIGWDAQSSKVFLTILWGVVLLVGTAIYVFKEKKWNESFALTTVGAASILAFLLISISAFFSDVLPMSFFGDGYVIGVPLFMVSAIGVGYVASCFAQDNHKGRSALFTLLGGIICVIAVVFVTIVIRRVVGLPDTATSYLLGMVGKWNDVGILSAILIVFSLYAIRKFALSGIGIILAYSAFVLGMVTLAMVNLIIVWPILGIASLLALINLFGKQKEDNQANIHLKWIVSALFVVSLLFVLDNYFVLFKGAVSNGVSGVLQVSSVEAYPSLSSTFTVARGVLSKSPLFGFGPGRFTDAWRLYRPQEINLSQFWSTDFSYGIGLWPTFLITSGILGALGVLIYIFAVLMGSYRLYRLTDVSGTQVYVHITVSSVVAFLTLIFFVYNPGLTAALIYAAFVGLLVGLLHRRSVGYVFDVALSRRSSILGLGTCILILIVLASTLYAYTNKVYAHYHYNKAVVTQVNDQESLTRVMKDLEKALKADKRDLYARSLGTAYYAQFNALLMSTSSDYTTADFQNMLNAVVGASISSVAANPYNSENYVFVAELFRSLSAQGVASADEQAKQFYTNALIHDPYNPLVKVLQARLAMQGNDFKTAKSKLEEAIALKPNYTEAVFLLSRLLVEEGGAKEAITKLEARASVGPVEPIVFFQLGYLKYVSKDYVGAIRALEGAVSLVPNYANALYFLGLSYYYDDKDDLAIAVFERIIELNPESQEAKAVLENMKAGTSPFLSPSEAPENSDKLPVEETAETSEE